MSVYGAIRASYITSPSPSYIFCRWQSVLEKAGGSHDSVRCGQCAVIQTSGLFGEAVVPACTYKLVRDSEHTAFLSGYLDRVKSPYRIVYQASLEISIGPESGE